MAVHILPRRSCVPTILRPLSRRLGNGNWELGTGDFGSPSPALCKINFQPYCHILAVAAAAVGRAYKFYKRFDSINSLRQANFHNFCAALGHPIYQVGKCSEVCINCQPFGIGQSMRKGGSTWAWAWQCRVGRVWSAPFGMRS